MDISTKLFWFLAIAGTATLLVFVMIRVGEYFVRVRTKALIDAHGDDADDSGNRRAEKEKKEEPPTQ